MGFAQHQSFYIRYNWITKVLKNIELDDNSFFNNKDSYLDLSIGKNMFASLKHWMIAAKIVEKTNAGKYELTRLGKILQEFDINCVKNDTTSLLHYMIVSDDTNSETWYWFFNVLNDSTYTKENLVKTLLPTWVESRNKTISPKSLKKDIDCLIQFYTVKESMDDPEDIIFSPFSKMGLLAEIDNNGNKIIQKQQPKIEDIGLVALMFILLEYCNQSNTYMISVDDMLNKSNLWKKVFNLEKQGIMEALNSLSLVKENPITFIRTNNLDTITVPEIDPIDFLRNAYKKGCNLR